GCTVVLKPAPDTPLTALALAELADEAGLPPGVLNVVTGNAVAIGEVLTSDPLVRLLTFTGSTAVGKQLMRQCAGTVKKVGLELGGNAPFIVFDDADLDAAAVGLMASKFRNSGQTCISANRIFVHAAVHDAFMGKLIELVNALCVGNGLDPVVDQGPLINNGAVEKVERHVADALRQGGVLVTGGKRHKLGGNFFEPTIIAAAHDKMLLAGEETFGPVAAIFKFDNEKVVCDMANKTDSGLAAYIYTSDLGRIARLADALEFGMVGVNTGAISTAVAPFGGVKESGIGREGSRHGIEEFTEIKYLNICISPGI
ncbi:MAG: aldehyde dehydrogenase family protein, partial [Mesorhizobium sp.]